MVEKVMLRKIDTGKLTDHAFIDQQHALEWLKKDTSNEERFTVCLVSTEELATGVCFGHFTERRHEVESEMTVGQFIAESMKAKDEKKHAKKEA